MNNEYPEIAQFFKHKRRIILLSMVKCAVEKDPPDFELLQSRINLKDLEVIKARIKQVPMLCVFLISCIITGHDPRFTITRTQKDS